MCNFGLSCSESVGLLFWLLVELIYCCLLQCLYCLNLLEFVCEGVELSIVEWIEVFCQVCELGVVQFGFFGGELLLCQDFVELIEVGCGLGFYINLIIFGIGFDEVCLVCFVEVGLDYVQISFQVVDEEVNNLFVGLCKVFVQKLVMVCVVKVYGYLMVFNFVIYWYNIDNIEWIIQLCIELEVDYVEFVICQFYGWVVLNCVGLLLICV